MSRLSVRFVATSLAAAVLAAPSRGAAQAAPARAASGVAAAVSPAPQGARVLTLDDALALADVRNETVLIAEAGVRRARGVEAQVHSERMPQLIGAASYDRTLKSEFEGLFDADTIGGGEDGGDNDFANLPFGQANVYRLGLSFSQVLYAGGRERRRSAGATRPRIGALSLGQTKAQHTLDVAQAFYDAALTDWLCRSPTRPRPGRRARSSRPAPSARPAGLGVRAAARPGRARLAAGAASSAPATTATSPTSG